MTKNKQQCKRKLTALINGIKTVFRKLTTLTMHLERFLIIGGEKTQVIIILL